MTYKDAITNLILLFQLDPVLKAVDWEYGAPKPGRNPVYPSGYVWVTTDENYSRQIGDIKNFNYVFMMNVWIATKSQDLTQAVKDCMDFAEAAVAVMKANPTISSTPGIINFQQPISTRFIPLFEQDESIEIVEIRQAKLTSR